MQASRYEPILNPGIERFAAHYGVMVECLPPRDPQKKGKIERPVPYVRRLYEAHGETWVGIEESQSYLDGKMVLANQRRHGTTQKRPIDLLVEERAALKPLPPTAYAVEQFHEGPVRKDGHVRFEHKYYSVDESYCGKSVVVLGGRTHVSIYCNGKLLEVHDRLTDPHRSKSTKPHHLKPWERSLVTSHQSGPSVIPPNGTHLSGNVILDHLDLLLGRLCGCGHVPLGYVLAGSGGW